MSDTAAVLIPYRDIHCWAPAHALAAGSDLAVGRVQPPGQRATLGTAAIEIGAQGVSSEELFPQTGCEEVGFQGGMRIDALQHIH